MKISYDLSEKFISNRDKLSIQFPNFGTKPLKKIKVIAQIQYYLIINCLKITVLRGLKKMNSKEIYFIIISSKINILTSQIYFEKTFHLYNFQWKDKYNLPRKVAINVYLRPVQYKILNNILYLNKKLDTIGLSNTQPRSSCRMEEEIVSHQFCYCTHMQDI